MMLELGGSSPSGQQAPSGEQIPEIRGSPATIRGLAPLTTSQMFDSLLQTSFFTKILDTESEGQNTCCLATLVTVIAQYKKGLNRQNFIV